MPAQDSVILTLLQYPADIMARYYRHAAHKTRKCEASFLNPFPPLLVTGLPLPTSPSRNPEKKKIGCEVIVDGEALPEYQTQINGSTISCYIPSEHGKIFEVEALNKAYVTTTADSLVGHAIIDGRIEFASRVTLWHNHRITIVGTCRDDANDQAARFGGFTTTEEDDDSEGGNWAGDLSTIRIEVWTARWRMARSKRSKKNIHKGVQVLNVTDVVSEKAANKNGRARDTLIKLDPPAAGSSSSSNTDHDDDDDDDDHKGEWFCTPKRRYATFVFKYATPEEHPAAPEEHPADAPSASDPETTVDSSDRHLIKTDPEQMGGPSIAGAPNASSNPHPPHASLALQQDTDQVIESMAALYKNLTPEVQARLLRRLGMVKPEGNVKREADDESTAGGSQKRRKYPEDANGVVILD
ncbi:hypothetical protein HDV00_002231 [Rhizophlyctis rosea]|nr:hypothetical protein HDV00_002231 [Rhizophlyctis rosea]